jgi:ribonuclease D
MQPDELAPPILITHPKKLEALAQSLAGERIVAVDTESNSLHAYQEQVCLVQFSTAQTDYLVDPLVLLDLSVLGTFFADPGIEKVFHAAEYDLICLKRDFGFEFRNLFDTMLAARILGRPAIGLGSLLSAEFGVQLEKRYQRANWGQRPLPPYLLAYARMDTHYLIWLRERLRAELEATGRWELAQEDFRRLTGINGKEPAHDLTSGETGVAINASRDLTPQQNAVLLELHIYRDQVARQQDRPLFKVFGDKTLLAIAEACPSDLSGLGMLPGMTERVVRRHGAQLLQAVRRGLQAAPVTRQRQPRPDEKLLQRLDALREWRKQAAKEMRVESDVVLPRDVMMEIVRCNPTRAEALAGVMADTPWRLARFGGQILEALKNSR